jgi:hypothetical protein
MQDIPAKRPHGEALNKTVTLPSAWYIVDRDQSKFPVCLRVRCLLVAMLIHILIFGSCLFRLARCCSFHSGFVDWRGGAYSQDCFTEAAQVSDTDAADQALALCLLQRNSIASLLRCGYLNQNKLYYKPVKKGSHADELDLSHLQRFDDDDGLVYVTPRDILLTIAMMPNCRCAMATKLFNCPYHNKQQFRACLCCEGVTQYDISCLQNFMGELGVFVSENHWSLPKWSCNSECSLYGLYDSVSTMRKLMRHPNDVMHVWKWQFMIQ